MTNNSIYCTYKATRTAESTGKIYAKSGENKSTNKKDLYGDREDRYE